jgi:hypothetical protein
MSAIMRALAVLVPALWLACAAAAEPDPHVQIEVDFLLGYVGGSGCEFYRNGTWHEAAAAQAHLHDKYLMLVGRRPIHTTEDFIDKVASYSSFSGEPYQVRCKHGAAVRADQWLRDELGRFRTFNKKPASSRGGSEAGWPALALLAPRGLAGFTSVKPRQTACR